MSFPFRDRGAMHVRRIIPRSKGSLVRLSRLPNARRDEHAQPRPPQNIPKPSARYLACADLGRAVADRKGRRQGYATLPDLWHNEDQWLKQQRATFRRVERVRDHLVRDSRQSHHLAKAFNSSHSLGVRRPQGSVAGLSSPQNYKVVVYASTNGYYIQPCVTEPMVSIAASGTMGAGGLDNGAIYVILVRA